MEPILNERYRWYTITLKDDTLQMCKFYFRGLTAGERRVAGLKATKFLAEQYVLSKTVLPVKNWDTMLAGSCAKLIQQIYRYSGVDEEAITFLEAIDWIQSEYGAMEACAIAMIPSCTPELLESCDPYIYAKYLVMGKFQYENMYGRPVEEAFLQNGIDTNPNPGPPVMPGRGEIGTQIEDSFTWKKQ